MVTLKTLAVTAIGVSSMLGLAGAHPGEHLTSLQMKREAEHAQSIAARAAEKFARCANSERAVAMRKRSAARRASKAAALKKRALKRDSTQTNDYDNGSHNYTGIITTDEAFTVNTSCILETQATIGPYWVEGELIRQDLTDGEEGVPMQLELEFVDVNTCEPVSGLYIDVWHANATGYYAGIAESGLDTTFLRGIQITDDDGQVTFDTLVAGHYDGRTVHTHLMVHQNVTAYDNGTYAGGVARDISQLFYETTLKDQVEATEPYASNANSITTNTEDSILNAITDESYDPFLKYIYLGNDISDGIFAYHSIGIDVSANYTSQVSAAAHLYETGGVASSNSGSIGGGAPSGGMNGTMNGTGPGGASPSGMGGMSGMLPSGTMSGTAGVSLSTAVDAASATTASATTSTSSSGATGRHSGFWQSMGFFTKSAQQPSDMPSAVAEHGGSTSGDRASGRPSGVAPTSTPSLGAHNNNGAASDKGTPGSMVEPNNGGEAKSYVGEAKSSTSAQASVHSNESHSRHGDDSQSYKQSSA